jgi:hypothetical protein
MHIRRTSLVALLAAATATTAVAQKPVTSDATDQPPVEWPILGGAVAGAVGLVVGARIGYELECADGCPGDFGGLGGTVLGGLTGEMLLLPVGVHLGNRRRGSFAADLTASLLSGSGALVFAAFTDPDAIYIAPVIQLATTVFTERRGAKARAERRVGFSVAPLRGGVAVAGTLTF